MGSRPCAGVTLALRFPVNSVQVRREERKLQITRLRMLLMVEALADAKRHTDSGAWSLKDQTARAPQRAITRATALPRDGLVGCDGLGQKGRRRSRWLRCFQLGGQRHARTEAGV